MAKMRVTEGSAGVSFNGVEYTADDNGIVDVPEAAVEELKNHGLTMAPAEKKIKGAKKDKQE